MLVALSIGNDECLLYKTCDFYGDYDCEHNPNCKDKHDWGCSRCEDGYWMINQQYPCRECPADCSQCQDYVGCTNNGCNEGYKWKWDDTCGYGKCIEDITYSVDGGCNLDLKQCASSKCGNDENPYCHEQNNWGCDYCLDGYFMKSHDYQCILCNETIQGCDIDYCSDWKGCEEYGCMDDYIWEWDHKCGIGRCAKEKGNFL